MKTLFGSLPVLLIMLGTAYGQNKIIGKWLTSDKKAQVEIYKRSDTYFGKIVWLKEPIDAETGKAKLDKANPNKLTRTQPIMGLVMLSNFTYNEADRQFKDGTIYDPTNGKTYKCKMWLDDKNILNLRGYILFLYRTEKWTRVP